MRQRVFLAMTMIACSSPSSTPVPIRPATSEPRNSSDLDTSALAARIAAISASCDPSKLADLFDRDELVKLVEKRAPSQHAPLQVTELFFSTGAIKFCALLAGAVDVRFLRARAVDGESRILLRKVADTGLGYFDVLARSGPNGARIVDVYSYNNGTWISQEIADALSVPNADDAQLALTVNRVNTLDDQGKHAEALAALDSLPEPARNTHSIQDLRVAISGRVSVEAYKQASEERVRRFPADKPTPMAAMNAAFLRGDFAEALHQLDVLDAAIGGDAFLDVIRAPLFVKRNGPGDLEAATAAADRAVRAEPKLFMTNIVKIGVALARSQWSTALSALDTFETTLHIAISEDQLRGLPNFDRLIATPEYREWRKRHP